MEQELNPRLEEARQIKRLIFSIDASHFVQMPYLGYLWCIVRVFIQAPSGRQRYNVLGALNVITHELITVTNTNYINALSVIDLIKKICEKHAGSCITLIMDNASYQRCNLVTEYAKQMGIELLFLPPYSPNLNLIERLWKFVKKECLYDKYHKTFEEFRSVIDQCLDNIDKKHKEDIKSLITLNFQLFDNGS